MGKTTIDDLSERYKGLQLTYFRHRKVTPWEKREKDATVNPFLTDLEQYLLENDWSVENRTEHAKVYRHRTDPRILLKVRNYVDYFGVHTVYLIEVQLVKERAILWAKVVADGELVFDYLKKAA
jgi:hypothetical protein